MSLKRRWSGAHIVMAANTAADGQGHEALFGGARHQIEHGAAILLGRHDVQKAQFIGACGIIGAGGGHRVARIHKVHKVDALDHTATRHV